MPRASAAQRSRWNRRLRSVSNRAEASTRAAMMRELNRAGERWDAGRHERAVKDILASAYRACAEASYPTARAMLGRAGREQVRSDTADPARVAWLSRVGGWVETMSARRARQIARESQRQVTAALREAAEAGDSEAAAAQRVRDRLGGAFARSRARTIARTEIGAAQNMAVMEAGNASGVEFRKVWCAAADERTRPSHAAADGQEVEPSEPFEVGDSTLDRPGDPAGDPAEVVNCRCTILLEPVLDEGAGASGADVATVPDPADAVAPVQPPPPPPRPRPRPATATVEPMRPGVGDQRPVPRRPIRDELQRLSDSEFDRALREVKIQGTQVFYTPGRRARMQAVIREHWRRLPADAPPSAYRRVVNRIVKGNRQLSDEDVRSATHRTWEVMARSYHDERLNQFHDEWQPHFVRRPPQPKSGWVEDDGLRIFHAPPGPQGAPWDPADTTYWHASTARFGIPVGSGRYWRSYTGDGASRINKALRDGNTLTPAQQSMVRDLDDQIARSQGLTDDLVVWRGLTEDARGFTDDIMGRVIPDAGFQSWSVNPLKGAEFAGPTAEGAAAVFRVRLPRGTKAIAGTDYEAEVILGRGRGYRVAGVSLRWVYSPDGNDYRLIQVIDVELLP